MVTVHVCSKLKTSWKLVVFTNKVGKNSRYFVGIFRETIIPLALVGYVMVIANSYPMALVEWFVKYGMLAIGEGEMKAQVMIRAANIFEKECRSCENTTPHT